MLVVDFPFLYLILIDWIGFVANWQNRYREGRCLFLSLKHLTDGEEEGCRCRCIYLARHTVVFGRQFEREILLWLAHKNSPSEVVKDRADARTFVGWFFCVDRIGKYYF